MYDVRARPSLIQSQSGSKDLQMVSRDFDEIALPEVS